MEMKGFGFARFPRASVEDIEFGLRLTRAGLRVARAPAIRGCHLKHWTFKLMVYTDFARRGVPWVRLLIERREVPDVLNLGWRHRITSLLTLVLGASLLRRRMRATVAALAAILTLNRSFYALLARRRGVREATLGVGLHLVHHLTALASIPAGAAVHLRRSLMRGGDPRVARRAPSKPVSHEKNVSARRFRRAADRDLRIGIVGCGRLAERAYVPAAELADKVTLAAVADPVAERSAAAAPGVPAFSSAQEMIESGLVDAVVIATPASTHLAIARAAQDAGLPVLVEKPPADDTAGAIALAELEPAPWLAFNRRFEPAVAALARLVPPGEPLEFDLSFSGRRAEWGAHDVRDDVLLDLGPHLIDLARVLSGAEIERVRARLLGEQASLELDLGVRGRALVELNGDRSWKERFTVRDSTGRTLGSRSSSGLRARAVRLARTSTQHPLVYSLARQLEAFSTATRGKPAPLLASAADGVAVMRAIDGARKSAAAGGEWVDVAAIHSDDRVVRA
jgi:predicted dehydrogenase